MPASQRSAERLSAAEQQQQPPPPVAMASSSLAEKHHHQTAAAPAAADRSFGGNGECCASGASFLSGRVFCDVCVCGEGRAHLDARGCGDFGGRGVWLGETSTVVFVCFVTRARRV